MVIDKLEDKEIFENELKLMKRRKPKKIEESDRFLVKTYEIFGVVCEVWFDKSKNDYFRINEWFKEGVRYA